MIYLSKRVQTFQEVADWLNELCVKEGYTWAETDYIQPTTWNDQGIVVAGFDVLVRCDKNVIRKADDEENLTV